MGGGVPSTDPLCSGAIFRLGRSGDLGAPQPTSDFVASLILDGERPFGRRASNRTIKLPVVIIAPTRQILAAAREVLEQTIDQDQFTITWTRDPGPGGTPLPLVLDCYRAQPSVPIFATWLEKQLLTAQITLTIPAMPYGRSDVQQQIAFASPVPASPPPPPAGVILDTYATIASPQCSQATQCIVGPYTACWDPDSALVGDPGGQNTPFAYGPAVFSSPQNLTGLPSMQMWLGFGSRYYPNLEYRGRHHGVRISMTLTDISGNTLSFSRARLWLPVSPVAQAPVFSRVSVPVPQGQPGFNYAAVASYTMTITNRLAPRPRLGWVTCYLDHLQAVPSSIQYAPVTRGFVYTLNGLVGTARAPLSLTFQQPPSAGSPATLTSAGPGSYTVPGGTAWGKVECTGGGGAGSTMTVSGTGGGGAGGEYAAEPLFPMSAGQVIPYSVGAGGQPGASPVPGLPSVFGPGPSGSMQVLANGGASAGENTSTGAGPTSGSGNSVENPGGAGRTNPAATVGGGGGSAGSATGPGLAPQGTGSVMYTAAGTVNFTCPAGRAPGVRGVHGARAAGAASAPGRAAARARRAAGVSTGPGTSRSPPATCTRWSTGAGGAGGSGSGASGSAGGQSVRSPGTPAPRSSRCPARAARAATGAAAAAGWAAGAGPGRSAGPAARAARRTRTPAAAGPARRPAARATRAAARTARWRRPGRAAAARGPGRRPGTAPRARHRAAAGAAPTRAATPAGPARPGRCGCPTRRPPGRRPLRAGRRSGPAARAGPGPVRPPRPGRPGWRRAGRAAEPGRRGPASRAAPAPPGRSSSPRTPRPRSSP